MIAPFVGLDSEQIELVQQCQQQFNIQISDTEAWPKYEGQWRQSHKYLSRVTRKQNFQLLRFRNVFCLLFFILFP
ncbi:MAG: hypothetical protein GY938_17220 [Ketobacter sp.]|nr:hypothetical protein [Ketobacter sp.]